jgi:hypothetical protein
MSAASYQTVRLSQGKHRDPDHGVCVMELSSMLAGEPFSDRPRCVCPVIAAFLRAYNDAIDDDRRQDLYRFAALAVGTRSGAAVQSQRAGLCVRWAQARQDELRTGVRRLLPPRPLLPDGRLGDDAAGTLAATMAARLVARRRTRAHEQALSFVEALVAVGAPASEPAADLRPRAPEPTPVA